MQDEGQGIKHGTTMQLNECQCKYVADEECLVGQGSSKQSQPCSWHSSEVLPHFHATVTGVKMLAESCCGERLGLLQP